MIGAGALAGSAFAGLVLVLATLALARATERLTRGHHPVPTHFGINGKPDAFGSRWIVVALVPTIHLVLFGFLVISPYLGLPTHGDVPTGLFMGQLISGLAFAGSQLLIYRLTRRWIASL